MGYSRYPTQIDTSTELPLSTDLVTPVKAEVVNRLRDAILAVETELGPDPSGQFSTVKDRLDFLSTNLGASGIQGPAGPAGPAGPPGIQGPQGVPGLLGVTGVMGPAGIQGSPGVTGPIGLMGNQGSPGIIGATGARGSTGIQGIQGSPGVTGAVGSTGPAGAQGIQGSPGVTGPQGNVGVTGPQGVTGVAPTRYIAPDSNDQYVWLLGDGLPGTTGAPGYVNTGQIPGVTMTSLGSGTFYTDSGIFGTAPNGNVLPSAANGGLGTLVGGAGQTGFSFPITLSCWFYFEYTGGRFHLVGRSNDSGADVYNESIALYVNSSNMAAYLKTTNGTNFAQGICVAAYPQFGTVSSGGFMWHHGGLTYDGSSVKLYFDGALVSSQVATGTIAWNTTNPWWIYTPVAAGDTQASSGRQLGGKIQDVRVANIARGATYFYNMFQRGMGRY